MREETYRARKALIYSDPDVPGYRRKRWGKGFIYYDPEGKRISDPDIVKRLKALVIPPAWKDVWIFPEHKGHIQATGRDAIRDLVLQTDKKVNDETLFRFEHAVLRLLDESRRVLDQSTG